MKDSHLAAALQVIGIGSGSTVPYVVERIQQQGEQANAGRHFIPTGPSRPERRCCPAPALSFTPTPLPSPRVATLPVS